MIKQAVTALKGRSSTRSLHAQTRQRFFEQRTVDAQAAAVGLDVLKFIEGAKQAQLDGGVLLGVIQGAAMFRLQSAKGPCGKKTLTA